MTVEPLLKNLGFSENEAKVYLASLEMGSSSAQDIAQKARVKRTTAYSVLADLVRRGFVHTTTERGKMRYLALAPKQLLDRFAEYQRELIGALPSLDAIYNKSQVKPKVVFFEGTEGMREIYQATLREKPNVILEYATDNIIKFHSDLLQEQVKQRVRHGIRSRRITPKSPKWMFHKSRDKEELSETVMLPTDLYHPEVDIQILDHAVVFLLCHDAMGLVIENTSIAEAMRQAYELAWHQAKAIARG